ncbi:FUSC family protein [Maridesulfovibrio bastinii]|uniref:FUSC family protein n=1 Tax=Maridesulfovibrio bastinii TaxID=47157 RepID=UPI00041DDA4D|nr:FUSC family protein [Maridesulfovibrio bastinii]
MSRFDIPADDVVYSLKNFCAAMLAFGIALYFNLPRPFWAISTVYVVSNPLSGASASKALYRLMGTLIGGIVTIAIIPPLAHSTEMLSAAIICWVSLCAYLGQLEPAPRNYVFHLAGYTILLTGLPVVDNPDQVFSLTLARVEEISISIICASLIHNLVFPKHAGTVLNAQIKSWMEKVTELSNDVFNRNSDSIKTRPEWHNLARSIVAMRPLTVQAAYDSSHHSDISRLLCALQDRIVRLPPLLSSIEDHIIHLKKSGFRQNKEFNQMLDEVRLAVVSGVLPPDTVNRLRRMARDIEKENYHPENSELIKASMAKRTDRFIELWNECSVLYEDIKKTEITERSKNIIKSSAGLRIFRDHRLAAFTAAATLLSIAVPMLFWVATGWTYGMLITQISGIFCCRWIGLDNPLILMKNTLISFVITAIISLTINFSLLPLVDGFLPLMLILGIFMIPAGAIRATIPLRIIGTLFCIFLPVTLELGSRITVNFEEMVNTDLALIFAVTCGIVITAIVKSAGAEPRARGLLHSGWRIIAGISSNADTDHETRLHNLLDLVSLWASRQIAIPENSKLRRHDLLRDLRVGYNIAELQKISKNSSAETKSILAELYSNVAMFYKKKQQYSDLSKIEFNIRDLKSLLSTDENSLNHRILALLASLSISLKDLPVHNEIQTEAINAGN